MSDHANARRVESLIAAALSACISSLTTLAVVQSEAVFQAGLALICLGGALMVAVCLFAEWQ